MLFVVYVLYDYSIVCNWRVYTTYCYDINIDRYEVEIGMSDEANETTMAAVHNISVHSCNRTGLHDLKGEKDNQTVYISTSKLHCMDIVMVHACDSTIFLLAFKIKNWSAHFSYHTSH